MRDLERMSNVPGLWLLLLIVVLLIVGAFLVERAIARKYDRWIDDLDARYDFRSHLDESEAAAIATMHQQHLQHNEQ